MATSESGRIDWSILPDNTRTSYEELRKWQPHQIGKKLDGTPIYNPWESHGVPGFGAYWGPSSYDAIGLAPSKTLDDLVNNARYIVEGVVKDQKQGFFMDEPMTLLTIEVARMAQPKNDKNFAVSHMTPMTEVLFVAYPSAHFTIGGHGFSKGDPSYPPLPSIGDKVLFFEFTLALDLDRVIFRPAADKILVERGSGTLNPKDYQQSWVKHRNREVPSTLQSVTDKVAKQRAFELVRSGGDS